MARQGFTYNGIADDHVKSVEGSNCPLVRFQVLFGFFTQTKLLLLKVVEESPEKCLLLLL